MFLCYGSSYGNCRNQKIQLQNDGESGFLIDLQLFLLKVILRIFSCYLHVGHIEMTFDVLPHPARCQSTCGVANNMSNLNNNLGKNLDNNELIVQQTF